MTSIQTGEVSDMTTECHIIMLKVILDSYYGYLITFHVILLHSGTQIYATIQ